MTIEEALAEIRQTNLPRGRKAQLAAEAVAADDTERRRICFRARAEAVEAAEHAQEAFQDAVALRADWAQRNGQKRPQPPARAGLVDRIELPEPRPVTVRHVKPTKPNIERGPIRAEGINAPQSEGPHICPPSHPHRTNCYSRHKCRCVDCRQANTSWQREYQARLKSRKSGEQTSD
jgi:hypothetical protein